MVAANWAAGGNSVPLPDAVLNRFGISTQDLWNGEYYRLLTATFLSRLPRMFVVQVALTIVVIGWYEWKNGSLRTAVLFFAINTVGLLLALLAVVAPLAHFGGMDLTGLRDVGMSSGGFGLLGASYAMARWRYGLMAITLVAIGVKYTLSADLIADSAHAITLVIGFAVQRMIGRGRGR